MKLELEQADIQAIAQAVIAETMKALKPMLDGRQSEDVMFTLEALCQYLHVEPDWVYKRTARKEIPCIKAGGLLRFRKKDIDRWLESCKTPAVNPLSARLKRVK